MEKLAKEKSELFWGSVLLGQHLDEKKRNCLCLEEIDCGDNESKFCISYKCVNDKKTISVFNDADVQRFFANTGVGGSNSGIAGQP